MIARIPSIAGTVGAALIAAVLSTSALPAPAAAADCSVVVVLSADLRPYREVLQGFRDACRCDVQVMKLRDGDVPERVRRTGPDAVVAVGTEAFRKMRQVQDVPLVHVMVIPAEIGYTAAGNLSGVSMDIAPDTWFSVIGQLFPGARRIGLLSDPRHTGAFVAEAQRAAADAGVSLTAKTVQGPDDVPRALDGLQKDIDLFWMLPDATVAAPPTVEYLLRFSIQHRIPIITFSKKYLELGAVASLDVDPRDMGAQAAGIVRRITQEGAAPDREYARRTRLTVNRSAAEKMGVPLGSAVISAEGAP